jgi:hypothetical protein
MINQLCCYISKINKSKPSILTRFRYFILNNIANIDAKQNVISDLDTIRSGAKNGTDLFSSTKYSDVKSMTFGIDTDTNSNNVFISFLRSDGWVLRVYFDESGIHYGAQNPNTKVWSTVFDK